MGTFQRSKIYLVKHTGERRGGGVGWLSLPTLYKKLFKKLTFFNGFFIFIFMFYSFWPPKNLIHVIGPPIVNSYFVTVLISNSRSEKKNFRDLYRPKTHPMY